MNEPPDSGRAGSPGIPGYRVERELGRGGMATVYLAEDLKHQRRVAVKVINPDIARTVGAERFLREIAVTARLSHPNILPLFDSGSAGGQLYYVMPYVAGETLRARINRDRQMPLDEAVRLTREVASALAYAHEHGTVHRDIKPENILLSAGIALVADFGIAHSLSAATENTETMAATGAGSVLGTPGYMSPEQVAAEPVDGRTDVYALACIVFEMLAGQPPFVAGSTAALMRMHLTAAARPITDLRPAVPSVLAGVIAKGLAKAPAERFETATGFAEAVALAATGGITPSGTRVSSGRSHNLPRVRTHFIGREKDLAECSRLLAGTQLLTITGIGGSGKTRLAVQLGERLADTSPDGVWFVDLAPISDGDRVVAVLAAVLGVPEVPGEGRIETVKNHLRDKQLFILLDNCEHVLDAAAGVANALLPLAGVRIIATSREGIGVEGERLFGLRSFVVPPAGESPSVNALLELDAVKLFVDRAQLVVHDFALTEKNAVAVADICRRLDGIPLAIELAAARASVLTVEQIREKLDDRFRLLTGTGRGALARHQTLQAALQWSYDLLAPAERELLRASSVFAGGWTLAHAATVGMGSTDEFAALEVLGRLIEKSLVVIDRERSGDPRYALLETVRQYARDRLIDAGDVALVRSRHAAAFLDLAERAYGERFAREPHWTAVLETEHDNLRAALGFVSESDPERYLQLAGALAWFWQARSHIVEGHDHLIAALAGSTGEPPRAAKARALWGAARIKAWQGDAASGRPMMEQSLLIWRQVGNLSEVAHALEGIGWMQLYAGEDETALRTFEECLRIQQAQGDPVMINAAMVAVAQMLVALSRVGEARPMASEIVRFSQARGDKRNEHFGWHYLADCALIEGDCIESLRLYQESLVQAQATGDWLEMSYEVQGVAMSLAGLQQSAAALQLAGAAAAEWERLHVDLHLRFWDALLDKYLGMARRALGDAAARSWQIGMAMPFDEAMRAALAATAADVTAREG